jgi:hypothetical protein
MPPLLLQCRLDGKPCAPGDNESQIQFKFPPLRSQMLCCDTRAFTWVVPRVSKGQHTVVMWGQIRNPELAGRPARRLVPGDPGGRPVTRRGDRVAPDDDR